MSDHREQYRRIQFVAVRSGEFASKAAFNAAARACLRTGDPTPADWVDAARRVRVTCERCSGTGLFIVGVHNGKPVSKGECFRCGGTGHQTERDWRRNYGYDNYAPISAV